MKIDVAVTPALFVESERSVCIVVDVLRASSACVAMFGAGAARVAVAESPDSARQLRLLNFTDALLCGEMGGLPPVGFDYGNSPVEFARLDLRDRSLVLATSNGTRALHAVANAEAVFVGCLLNRAAVCDAAIEAARRFSAGIVIVCAGNAYGMSFSLDDTFVAGAMVDRLQEQLGDAADFECTDAAQMAVRLFHSYGREAAGAFGSSSHGRLLAGLGFDEDLELCGRLDSSGSVPVLRRDPSGFLLLLPAASD